VAFGRFVRAHGPKHRRAGTPRGALAPSFPSPSFVSSHPNVYRVYDFGEFDGQLLITMLGRAPRACV